VLKQRFWLGILGLIVGAMLAYFLPKTYTNPWKTAPVAAVKSTAAAQPRPTVDPEPKKPRTLLSYSTPKTLAPKPAAARSIGHFGSSAPSLPYRSIINPPIIRTTPGLLPGSLSGVELGVAVPSHPNDGRLWSESFASDLNNLTGGGNAIQFSNALKETDNLPSLSVSNMSGIGLGYRFLESEDTVFKGVLGGALSQDYLQLQQNERVPEVQFGFQFEHQLGRRNKIFGEMEFARDMMEYNRKRVQTKAAWEVLLNDENNVSMRTGIQKNTKTAPDGAESINLNYTLDLIWKF
jgi:hypothetical protein